MGMKSKRALGPGAGKASRLAITYEPVASLRPDPKNPRIHSEKQVQQIARSIEAFGFNVPLLVNADMQIVAGHGRLQACQVLGITEVPTISLERLTEAQARAFMIADNRLTENATWDDRLLAQQFKDLSEVELDFSLEATGFEMGEIDVMVENLAPAAEGKQDPDDAVPERVAGIQVSQAGDLWQLGRHKVYCGNSLNESTYGALMGGAKATMVFTDPPYNVRIDGHATGLGPSNTKTSGWRRVR
jgi:ParB-like chromosome segregation protein Spo0J